MYQGESSGKLLCAADHLLLGRSYAKISFCGLDTDLESPK